MQPDRLWGKRVGFLFLWGIICPIMQNELLTIITDLVTIPSTKDNSDALHQVVSYVEDYFKGMKVVIRTYASQGKPSIVVLSQDTYSPTLFLNGHLDVVEADTSLFALTQDGDRITGRGVFDMKGYVAVMMLAFKRIVTENPDVSIGLMLTTDEEIGGTNGVEYLLEKEGYTCDVAYVPDGGNGFSVVTDEKGIIHLKLTATGTAAHGARPWLGVSATEKLVQIFSAIRSGLPNPVGEEDWKRSLNLGKISGGVATNQVADHAEMFLDIRFPYPDTVDTIKAFVSDCIATFDGVSVEEIASGSVSHVDPDNAYLVKYLDVLKETVGGEVQCERACGASDGRFFAAKGIPVVMSRGAGGGQHAPDEWASVDGLVKSVGILLQWILKL